MERKNIKFIIHLGVHKLNNNAGDVVLFPATRALFDSYLGNQYWKLESIREPFTKERINYINSHASAVLIGGGGLILDKGFPTGWQLNCLPELLDEIKVPIIVFAIGFNLFRGQKLTDAALISLSHLAKKAVFFSMRENQAVKIMRELTGCQNIRFQPCPATLLSKIYSISPFSQKMINRIGFNWAGDRENFRLGVPRKKVKDVREEIFRKLAGVLQGRKIDIIKHVKGDERPFSFINGRYIDLFQATPETIINYYTQIPLTIGMRGHSQMIPFGLGNGIISLVSHNKMSWFLDDARLSEQGVEITSPKLVDELTYLVKHFDYAEMHRHITCRQQEFWDLTLDNLEEIKKYLRPT